MSKTIEQLLELANNPYYSLSNDEQAELDAFLSKKSEQSASRKTSGDNSEKNIPATVLNKNKVQKETGEIAKINDSVESESAAVEETVHPDAVN